MIPKPFREINTVLDKQSIGSACQSVEPE